MRHKNISPYVCHIFFMHGYGKGSVFQERNIAARMNIYAVLVRIEFFSMAGHHAAFKKAFRLCSIRGRAVPCGANAQGKHFFLHTGRSARLWEKRAFPLRAALLRHIAARRMRHEGCLSWGRTLPRSLGTAGLMRSFPGIIPDNRSRAQRSGSALCRVHRQGGPGRAAHPSFLVK